jgi:hypothetical protein
LKKLFAEMNKIDRQHITSTRNLNLYADADMSWSSVDRLPLDPIDATSFLLGPPTHRLKLLIDEDPKHLGAVRIPALFDEKFEAGDKLPSLI